MIRNFLYRILCGFFLGVSVFAPGFSGSLVAITMGIYQDLLRIISNPFKSLKQNIKFCFPLAIGAAISAVLFLLTFRYLFDTYEKATYLLFVGLITGNLPVIYAEVKKCGFQKRYLIGGAGAFAAAFAFGVLAIGLEPAAGAQAMSASWLVLALSGVAGGVTAIVPGMSVTIVLLIAGVYSQLIHAAELLLHMDFTYFIPFGFFCVCALAGLVSASRVIKLVFEKFPGFSNSTVFGFMSGSLIGILIQSLRIEDKNFNWLLGGAMLAAGLAISMFFVVMGKKMNKAEAQ